MISIGDLVRIKDATSIHPASYPYKRGLVRSIQKIDDILDKGSDDFPDHTYIVKVQSMGGLQFSEEELELVFTV